MKKQKISILLGAMLLLGQSFPNEAFAYGGTIESKDSTDHKDIDGQGQTYEVDSTNEGILYAEGDGKIVFKNGVFETGSGHAGAIMAYNGGVVEVENVHIKGDLGDFSVNYNDGIHAYAGTVTMNQGKIEIGQKQSQGILVGVERSVAGDNTSPNKGGKVVLNDVDIIVHKGNRMDAISIGGTSGAGQEKPTVIMTGGSIVQNAVSEGGNSTAIKTYDSGEAYLSDVTITVKNDRVIGYSVYSGGYVNVTGGSLTTQGVQAHGALIQGNATFDAKNTIINTSGDNAVGVFGFSNSNATLSNTDIKTSGNSSYGVYLGADTAEMTINGGSITTSGENADAIYVVQGTSTLNGLTINAQGANSNAIKNDFGTIEGKKNNYQITGDIVNTSSSAITNMDYGDGSNFIGATSYEDGSTLDFTMNGTANWNMNKDSQLTSLDMEQGGHVHLLSNDNNGYGILTTKDLVGEGGTFYFRTDIAAKEGDLLKVTGTSEGNHLVHVENNGSATTDGTERLTIIDTIVSDDATNSFKLTNKVEVGGYQYELRRSPDEITDWELYSTGKATDPADGGVNLFGSNYMLAYAETQTLMQRLGDLRRGEDSQKDGDMWARAYGGKLSSGGDSMLKSYDMKYSGFQLGMDRSIDRKDGKGTSYAGAFVGYTNGSPDYSTGDGDIDGFSIGGYYTYMHETGFYSDLVMKYGWYDNEYDIRDSAGQKVKAESDSKVLSLSLEVGKRFHFDKERNEGYYIEPQAQFTYAHFTGDTYRASNGLTTKVDSFASKLARLGMHLGYETKNTKNPMNLYIKGYFMKEFDGNIDYRFNGGNKHRSSYEDNWFVYGFGATMQLGSKKNQNLYLDFERSSGGRMKQDWAINVGYRYNW